MPEILDRSTKKFLLQCGNQMLVKKTLKKPLRSSFVVLA